MIADEHFRSWILGGPERPVESKVLVKSFRHGAMYTVNAFWLLLFSFQLGSAARTNPVRAASFKPPLPRFAGHLPLATNARPTGMLRKVR